MTIRAHLCRTCETSLQNTAIAHVHERSNHQVDTVVLYYRTRGKGALTDWQWSSNWQKANVPTVRPVS